VEDGCHWRGHRWRSQREPTCVMARPASASALLVTREEFVECAADLGKDADDFADTHQLVRESGGAGVSVSMALPATLACVRVVVVGAPAGVCAGGTARPLMSLSTPGIQPRRISPKRTATEPRAGIVSAPPIRWYSSEGALLWEGGSSLSASRTWMPPWCRRLFRL
jgi:hypothetical protein